MSMRQGRIYHWFCERNRDLRVDKSPILGVNAGHSINLKQDLLPKADLLEINAYCAHKALFGQSMIELD